MSSPRNHIDENFDLIDGCKAGNRKMQQMLYDVYSPKMYALCMRYCACSDDAKDLLQEGFIKVFHYIKKYRGEGSFEGWIRRIFTNTAIEFSRRKIKFATVSENYESDIEDGYLNGFDNLAESDIISIVQRLSPGYRFVFNMFVIEGYSHKEIGAMLGISEGTSKSQLARAKVVLRSELEKKYSKENEK